MGLPERREVRVGDAERQAVVDQLRGHLGAGRLELDEFEERTAQALAARTVAELEPVTADLPAFKTSTKGPPIRQRNTPPPQGWDLAWRIHWGVAGVLCGLFLLIWVVTLFDMWPMIVIGALGVSVAVHGVVKKAVEGG